MVLLSVLVVLVVLVVLWEMKNRECKMKKEKKARRWETERQGGNGKSRTTGGRMQGGRR